MPSGLVQSNTTSTDDASCRLVIQSIGDADARMVQGLRPLLRMSDRRIAEKLYRAPAELVTGLNRDTAEQMKGVLEEAGLEAAVLDASDPFEPGDDQHEIALSIERFDHIDQVLVRLATFIGGSADEAKTLLCREPAVIMGGVSAATVRALRRRFEPLGCRIDAAARPEARFDVFLGPCPTSTRRHVLAALESVGLDSAGTADETAPVVATDISAETAGALWEQIARVNAPCQIVNRAFQRCDVTLDAATDTPEVRALLIRRAGMPETVVGKVLGATPVVLASRVALSEAEDWLAALAEVGAAASAHLLSCRRFGLAVDAPGDRTQTDEILRWLGDVPAATRRRLLAGERFELEGPYTHTQARWMVWALKRCGGRGRMVLR